MINQINKKYRLPRKLILRKSADIRSIFNTGTKLTGRNFNVFYKTANSDRFAVLTPKRIGTSVQRNKMKRLAREIYRKYPQRFQGKMVIFFVKRYNDNYAALEQEIHQLVTPQ